MSEALVATCWTSAGKASPAWADQRSPVDFVERVRATAAAGFTGMGFLTVDLQRAEAVHGIAGMKSALADHGIGHLEIELLSGWWADGAEREASDETWREMLRFAEQLGAYDLKIGPDESGDPWELEVWAAAFAHHAGQAADVGARLGIEFLPWMNIATVSDGLELVQAAGHPAGGLIVDVWHTERTATSHEEIAALPPGMIVGVELSDAHAQVVGTLPEDTMNRRRLPGAGDFDLPGVIAALRQAGWQGPWGVEILADWYRELPLDEAMASAVRSTREVLCRPRSSS